MSDIKVKVTVKDVLGFYDDYLGDYSFNSDNAMIGEYFYDVPAEWWTGKNLTESAAENILRRLYGENWQAGNDDGSKYRILDFRASLADADEQEKES